MTLPFAGVAAPAPPRFWLLYRGELHFAVRRLERRHIRQRIMNEAIYVTPKTTATIAITTPAPAAEDVVVVLLPLRRLLLEELLDPLLLLPASEP